jgi:hypothetical protein
MIECTASGAELVLMGTVDELNKAMGSLYLSRPPLAKTFYELSPIQSAYVIITATDNIGSSTNSSTSEDPMWNITVELSYSRYPGSLTVLNNGLNYGLEGLSTSQ